MSVARDGAAPWISAGSVYSIEVTEPMPVTVTPGASTWLRPRSASLAPPLCSSMFCGLMSRCTMPASCRACAAARRVGHGADHRRAVVRAVAERAVRQVLHRVVERLALLAGVVERDEVRRLHRRERRQLARRPPEHVLGSSGRTAPSPPRTRRRRAAGPVCGRRRTRRGCPAQRTDELVVGDAVQRCCLPHDLLCRGSGADSEPAQSSMSLPRRPGAPVPRGGADVVDAPHHQRSGASPAVATMPCLPARRRSARRARPDHQGQLAAGRQRAAAERGRRVADPPRWTAHRGRVRRRRAALAHDARHEVVRRELGLVSTTTRSGSASMMSG